MSIRQRHKQLILISDQQSNYETAQTEINLLCEGTLAFNFNKALNEVPRKTGQMMLKESQRAEGRHNPDLTITAPLNPNNAKMLMYFLDWTEDAVPALTEAEIPDEDIDEYYTVYQVTPTASDNAGQGIEAVGCKLSNFRIYVENKEMMLELQLRCKEIDPEKAIAETLTLPGGTTYESYPSGTPYHLGDVTIGSDKLLKGNEDEITNLEVSMTAEFADDDVNFTRNTEKRRDIICRWTGQITASYVWHDDALNEEDFTDIDVQDVEISLVQATSDTIKITSKAQLTEFDKPDDNTCVYTATITAEILDSYKMEIT